MLRMFLTVSGRRKSRTIPTKKGLGHHGCECDRYCFSVVLRAQNELSTKQVLVSIMLSDEGRIPSASGMLLENVACVGIGRSTKAYLYQYL